MAIKLISDPFHVISNEINIPQGSLNLNFFATDSKIETVRAYHFHPDRTGFFATLWNRIIEFFMGKTAILIHIDTESHPVYVKVDEVSQKLLLDKKILQQEIKDKSPEEISAFLKMEAAIKKIQDKAPGMFEKNQVRELIHTLSKEGIDKEKIVALLKQEEFSSTEMAKILMELGQTLKIENSSDRNITYNDQASGSFKFIVRGSNIRILKRDQHNLISLNPKTLALKKRDLLFIKFKELAKPFNLKKHDLKHLFNLSQQITYPTIINSLNKMNDDNEKRVLLNTLIQIGKETQTGKQASRYLSK